MINLLAFLFASGVGFGLACWIFGTILDKSNNIGDSHGSNLDYSAYVHITTQKDRMSNSERDSFTKWYAHPLDDIAALKGNERVRRLSEEERNAYKEASAALKPHVKGDMTNDGILDSEDEFLQWERQQETAGTQSAFKPLDND